jgi:predicted HAD superfamily Cof-like phosphohydrolase
MSRAVRDVFYDQASFMRACSQNPGRFSPENIALYMKLVEEERTELRAAVRKLLRAAKRRRGPATRAELVGLVAEVADGGIDLIYVCAGLLHALGIPDPHSLWAEVHRSNMAKVDRKTKKVLRRPDGKVLKPEGWTPPNLVRKVEVQFSN